MGGGESRLIVLIDVRDQDQIDGTELPHNPERRNPMTRYIESFFGHTKTAGAKREKKSLSIFAEAVGARGPDKFATIKFGDAAPQFKLMEELHAGVFVGITANEGRSRADSVAEYAVILTLEQAELLAARIQEAIALNRRLCELAKKRRKKS